MAGGEISQAAAELNRARVALEQGEAPVEGARPQPGEIEVKPDDAEAAWRDFSENPEDDDLRLNVEEDEELEGNAEAPPRAPDAGITINQPPPCDRPRPLPRDPAEPQGSPKPVPAETDRQIADVKRRLKQLAGVWVNSAAARPLSVTGWSGVAST